MPRVIINKGVYCFLKHSFFISADNLRRVKIDKLLKAVISINNSPIKIVEIGGGEPTAVQRNHRAKIRRNNGNYMQYHPIGFYVIFKKIFCEPLPLDKFFLNLSLRLFYPSFHIHYQLFNIQMAEQLGYGFSANSRFKNMTVFQRQILIFLFCNYL